MSDKNSESDTAVSGDVVATYSVKYITFVPPDGTPSDDTMRLEDRQMVQLAIDVSDAAEKYQNHPARVRIETENGEEIYRDQIDDLGEKYNIKHATIAEALGGYPSEETKLAFLFEWVDNTPDGIVTRLRSAAGRVMRLLKRALVAVLMVMTIILSLLFPERLSAPPSLDTESGLLSPSTRKMKMNHCAAEGFELPFTFPTNVEGIEGGTWTLWVDNDFEE